MPADALRDHLALALVPGLGPRLTARLLDRFGSPAAVLRLSERDLQTVEQIGPKLAASVAAAFRTVDPDAELARLAERGVRAIPLGHPDYPDRLTTIPDPPPLLYLRGTLLPADERSVAIVGSRNCTAYGVRTAERIAGGLARAGWTVVSGLARGIDGAAHKAALDAGGRTLAVLANGLSSVYPPEHAGLADRVAAGGGLLSEATMAAAPQAGMFPARNRIVSGLSRAVVVVEANVRSGALITVDHAADQGRPVLAVPGPVDSPASAGCLELIRTGAALVRDADDVIEEIRGLRPADPPPRPARADGGRQTSVPSRGQPPQPQQGADVPRPPKAAPPNLDPVQQKVWDALAEPRHADEVARESGLSAADLNRVLVLLEMKRVVARLPGNRFERR
jgi:DNA processing protein